MTFNQDRLQQVVRVFKRWADSEHFSPPFDELGRVRWVATADGWLLTPIGADWKFEAPTMDECVEQFAAEILKCIKRSVEERQGRYDEALARLREIEGALAAA